MDIIRPFDQLPELQRREHNESFVPFVFIENLFSHSEVEKIKQLWDVERQREGKITGNKTLDHSIRKSKIIFIKADEGAWIYDRLALACIMINAQKYQFSILGFQTQLQLTQYQIGDFYDWHLDFGSGKSSMRKLSITVQLSDPDEYEGGELELIRPDNKFIMPKTKGTAIIFPSYLAHRVLPVSSGVRLSIVGWIAGPPYC